MRVLMISTDRKIFESGSAVHSRLVGYAMTLDGLFIVVLGIRQSLRDEGRLKYLGLTRLRSLFWRPPQSFDLVTSQDPFETGLIARRLAKSAGAKLELQIHTDIGSPYFRRQSFLNWLRFWLARWLLPRADQIRVVSERIQNFLIFNFRLPVSKITIRPIAVDGEQIKGAPVKADLHKKYPQFNKIILMASRLTFEKNIGLAIEAMRRVLEQFPQTGLIIVGSGAEDRKLKTQSAKLGLTGRVVFEDWTDRETLFSYYKTANLFLVTSLYEGYGMALVEASAAGCPVVSTDVGVAREQGAAIADFNPRSVAAAILERLK